MPPHMRPSLLPLAAAAFCLAAVPAAAGVAFSTPGQSIAIDFDNGVTINRGADGSGSGRFTGSGFGDPNAGTPVGSLDSRAWAVNGMSDGSTSFGDVRTSGDFARGTDADGGVGTGGIYAFLVDGGANTLLGVQPGGSDFAPGGLFLRVQNLTGAVLNTVSVAYDIWVNNDQARSNALDLLFDTGPGRVNPAPNMGTTYQNAGLDFASAAAADGLGFQRAAQQSTTLTGLNIADGDFLYLQFQGRDVTGLGTRDEFGLDNISLRAQVQAVPELGSTLLFALAGLGGVVGVRRRRAAAAG